ncbi:Trk system potassium transporter TrkA [Parasporobacterium paucivorans]|uniref:Trk system potassium uptake protein TrkA n=1 Tax=Parasporobacterium paucivorans DSM 15970 TaxID=1122934 RepID=A0A1M6HPF8_9FIRM|nr:Trk system potassium transporter TrkA [Parasporobacterium paucivorans]SHJ24079.1 trk system potassium uptake protein TrkA [Parasporobacterium paucivorans DSM 15970]
MEIIIIGCGKVGAALAQELVEEGHTITIVDTNKKVLDVVSLNLDVLGIAGNGASYSVLLEAGVDKADILIAVTDSDEMNLLCCLFAKKVRDLKTIARVRNPIYTNEVEFLKTELELSMIINPEKTAAYEIASILRFPSAIQVENFAKGLVELLSVEIPEGSILNDMPIMEISTRLSCDVLVCVLERDEKVIIPSGDIVLKTGDKISVVAEPTKASEFFRKSGIVTNRVKNAMIVGGGKISHYLAVDLIKRGIDVKIIEKNLEICEKLSMEMPKATIIHADGTDQEVLKEEGLLYVEAFLPLTDMDEQNVILALVAKSISKAKVITKINKIPMDTIMGKLKLGSVVHPKFITADYILQYVRALQNSQGSSVETLYKIADNKAEALAFKVKENCRIINQKIETLQLIDNLLVTCIIRDGRTIIPRGKDVILPGDTVIVVTTNVGLYEISDILKK